MTPLAFVYRGSRVESFHTGSIVIVDSLGRILAYTGEPHHETFLRSAAKPFQGIPLLEWGGVEEYDLTPEEIALTCASHGGEDVHVAAAAALLRKGELDESDLLCGAHVPYAEKAAAELRASGEPPSVLHNNCSGKHAGMLLAAKLMDATTANYIDAGHPVQKLMHETIADFAGLTPDDIAIAIDGCGVPAFHLSLYRAAFAYARLMASREPGSPGALDRYAASAPQVVDAMTQFPYYVAGSWSMTTPLMEAFDGDLLAKEGAEGFYGMAVTPGLAEQLTDRLRITPGTALGIALKINDGSMTRGRNPVVLKTLALLGIDLASLPPLQRYRDWPLRNVAGNVVGDVRAEFDLDFL